MLRNWPLLAAISSNGLAGTHVLMLFIPTLFLFFSFCAKLKIPIHPILTVYGSKDGTAKFPTLHSQLLIIKNGGHNIEEAMCIYISLAERSILND